jgi:hypothetical protein
MDVVALRLATDRIRSGLFLKIPTIFFFGWYLSLLSTFSLYPFFSGGIMRRFIFSFIVLGYAFFSSLSSAASPGGTGRIPVSHDYFVNNLREDVQNRDLPAVHTFEYLDEIPPENQGVCGSCWSFALMGMIESRVYQRYEVSVDFSEQYLVSCATSESGCCGGDYSALEFIEDGGLIYRDGFPYGGGDPLGTRYCANDGSGPQMVIPTVDCLDPLPQRANYYLRDWNTVSSSDSSLKGTLFDDGPIYVWFTVYEDFDHYWDMNDTNPQFWSEYPNGAYVYDGVSDEEGGHAVLLVGYNDEEGYWLLQNSWGEKGPFSDSGLFRIDYDANCGFGGGVTCEVRRSVSEQLVTDNEYWDVGAGGHDHRERPLFSGHIYPR